jgi:hypothetical protein
MRPAIVAIAISIAVFLSPLGAAHGVTVAFFDNGLYTDPLQESALLAASLTALGHSYSTFSGITAADWTTATAGRPLLVIPELDRGDLYSALSVEARAAIAAYVSAGGGLIMFDRTTSAPRTINMLNGIFGFSLTPGTVDGDQTLNASAAAGTAFAGGPATLPDANATEGMSTASLPVGAKSIYQQDASTSLFVTDFGAGKIAFLGFDWFQEPTPADWQTVLGLAISETAGPNEVVPEPTTLILLSTGLAGALARRFRRSKRA